MYEEIDEESCRGIISEPGGLKVGAEASQMVVSSVPSTFGQLVLCDRGRGV